MGYTFRTLSLLLSSGKDFVIGCPKILSQVTGFLKRNVILIVCSVRQVLVVHPSCILEKEGVNKK